MTKFALFGAGFIGKVHANNIAAHPRATLQYVYDINTEAAQQVASRLGAHVASTPEEIWAADDVDCIPIGLGGSNPALPWRWIPSSPRLRARTSRTHR